MVVNRELIIDVRPNGIDIALLEDKNLVELHREKLNNDFAVGDIYLGKVKKIMAGLNASFINVGHPKDAFLHYLDLGSNFRFFNRMVNGGGIENKPEDEISKSGKIGNILSNNRPILVQIAKEPISTKGPRVTSEISFAGRYIVLVPFSNKISISQKIRSSEERNRLKRIVNSFKLDKAGVIIRTISEGRSVEELRADYESLLKRWEETKEKVKTCVAPCKVSSELNKTSVLLREILNESFNNIWVSNVALFEEIKSYIRTISPEKEDIVKLYKGKESIFDYFPINKQIRNSFGKVVRMKSGLSLVIEHTEALHVIDVNSGHKTKSSKDQETNAMEANLEAATEIARQLRLRDMGGIIVIDFIDIHNNENKSALFNHISEQMSKDKAKHTILPLSKFCLIQITRQRVRPETEVTVVEKCPVCDGTGEVKSTISITETIESNLKYLIQEQNEKGLTLVVHPFICSYLKAGVYNYQWKWFFQYNRRIRIKPDNTFHYLEYQFVDKKGETINI